jgi:general secretion pathway protein A
LLGAYATGETVIKPGVVSKAAREVLPYTAGNFPFQRTLLVSVPILIGIGTAFYFYTNWAQMGGADKQAIIPASSVAQNAAAELLSKPDPSVAATTTRQEKKSISFSTFISNPELTMDRALLELLDAWTIAPPSDHSVDCNFIQLAGLRCLFDQDSWKKIIALNRPVILEFSLGDQEKHYAFLVGTKQGQPVFRLRKDIAFPLDEVLPFWQGYFFLIWQAPNKGKSNIHPQQSSEGVIWLRKVLAAIDQETVPEKQPEFFDKALEKKLILFQKQHHLSTDGVVGPRTIIHLQNQAEIINFPILESVR